MEPSLNQVPPKVPQDLNPPSTELLATQTKKSKKIWKIVVISGVVFFTFFIIFAWYGFRLEQQDKKRAEQVSLPTPTPVENKLNQTTITFPEAKYKNFALSESSDSLNTKTAYPNLNEYGSPHLEIIKNNDGFSDVSLPLLGLELKVPFGWGSKGGFDTMERIDFFPAPTQSDIKDANINVPKIDLGIKILNSKGLGATDFKSVLEKIKEISSDGQTINVETDESNNIFLVKTETINNSDLKELSSSYKIYIKDPNPSSTVWVSIDIRAPKAEFQKYLGLFGLVTKDIKINWAGLDAYMKGEGQSQ